MSFINLLRDSRSKPVASLHKFLTNYDPNNPRRCYGFVEGEADLAFYRSHIHRYVADGSEIYLYNCDGKKKVYEVFQKVIGRYVNCRRVLFFVDKDVDDIIGTAWPSDPRIFTTDCYSIENYVVSSDALLRFFADYVKIRKFEIGFDKMTAEFDHQLSHFYEIATPFMAWIVAMRRRGTRVLLSDVQATEFCRIPESGTRRRPRKGRLSPLAVTCQIPHVGNIWREVRKTSAELRRMDPKRYVRGKFEAWWFVKFINRVVENLARVAKEDGGSISVSVALNEGNFIQLLAGSISTPHPLGLFLQFHLQGAEPGLPKIATSPPRPASRFLSFLRLR